MGKGEGICIATNLNCVPFVFYLFVNLERCPRLVQLDLSVEKWSIALLLREEGCLSLSIVYRLWLCKLDEGLAMFFLGTSDLSKN